MPSQQDVRVRGNMQRHETVQGGAGLSYNEGI